MRVLNLHYHDIARRDEYHLSGFQGADADLYKVEPEELRQHLRVMASVPGLNVRSDGTGSSPRFETIRLTFDDGGSGAWTAAEMLEQFGWRGYFFVVTDLIGTPEFLSESQIAALHRRGHIIGSHSCSHPVHMWSLSAERLYAEWSDSVCRLSEIVQAPITTASVPFGFYARKVAVEAAKAGVRILFTSEPVTSSEVIDGCMVLGRFPLKDGVSPERVRSMVAGEALPRWGQYLWWNCKKPLKTVGGKAWLAARRRILAMGPRKAA